VTEGEVELEDAQVFEEVVQRLAVALLALEIGDNAMAQSHLTAALEVSRGRATCLAHHLVGIAS
jgi:hypothetical protein